jgi:hypothetical protein
MARPLCRSRARGYFEVATDRGRRAHFPNDFGLELRVLRGDELIESRLSRYGEAPLLLIADEVKANLLEQGWREPPNATADA